MLTKDEAFQVGFLLRCAEEGLSGTEIDSRLQKVAEFSKHADDSIIGSLASVMGHLVGKGMSTAIGTGLVGGGLLGAGTALATQDMHDPLKIKQPVLLNRIQKAELASAYRQNAELLRNQIRNRKLQQRISEKPVRSPYSI